MRMLPTERKWTVDEVLALPADGNRYEVVDGELLVTPSPTLRHQRLLGELYRRLAEYLRKNPVATVFFAPADYFLDDKSYVQPDLFVVPGHFSSLPDEWRDLPAALLVVEILSPGSLRADRNVKRPRYQRAGIDEIWIVDPQWRTVERWRSDDDAGESIGAVLEWHLAGASEAFRLDVAEYFRESIGE